MKNKTIVARCPVCYTDHILTDEEKNHFADIGNMVVYCQYCGLPLDIKMPEGESDVPNTD